MAFRGIDVRESGDRLLFRVSLKDSTGAKVISGSSLLCLYEVQSDGTLESYDWADNTFKSTTLTTETVSMTHRTGNNGATNTGIWTYALTTLTGFVAGNIYIATITNSNAVPETQEREFQFASGVLADTVLVEGADVTDKIQTASNAALVAQNLDHLIKVAKDTDWGTTVTKESLLDLMTSKNSSQTFNRTTDSQEAAIDALVALLPSSLTSNGNMKVSLQEILTTALTETAVGYLAVAFKKLFDVAVPIFTVASANQSADNDTKLTTLEEAITEIWDKTMTELSAVPGVNGTVLQALSFVFMIARNKITQTGTVQTLYKDDGSTALATSSVSDNGTTGVRGEMTTA